MHGHEAEDWLRDELHVPPPPHRGAPTDEIHEIRAETWRRIRPPMSVKLDVERMDGEGGGSGPMNDAPEDGDLRFLHRRLEELERQRLRDLER